MVRMIHVLLCYAVQDIFEDYLSNCTKRGMVQHGTIFSKVGLRKFILASKLFVLRSYFVRQCQYKI